MPTRRLRWGLVAIGVLGLLVYARFILSGGHEMSFTPHGPPHFLYVSPGEARLLLLHTLLAVPSALALLVGVCDRLASALDARLDRWANADAKELRTATIAFAVILFAIYRVGRTMVLQDLPVTDDENGIDFGARILAGGSFSSPRLEPVGAFLELFLHVKDGRVASFDWPGGVLFRALSFASGTGDHLYAAFAAIGGTAIVVTAHRLLGARAGLLAAVVLLVSPLALGLSLTTHAHVVSRTFIALAIALWVAIDRDDGRNTWRAVALGLCVGAAFMTRPFESIALLLPLGLSMLVGAARGRARRATLAAVAGFLAVLVVFAVYDLQVTGTPWLPPRFDRAHVEANPMPGLAVDERLALHVPHNLMLLGVYLLGVLGLPVAVVGALTGRAPLGLLGLGVALSFGLMLGHDNIGIHTIGPIHYTDTAPIFVLLFVAGVERLATALPAAAGRIRACAFGYAVLAVGLAFTLPWLGQLQNHGEFVARPHAFLAASQVRNAIVISPQLAGMRRFEDPGSWQLNMPHPDPWLEQDIVFALPQADPDALHRAHPTRSIYRLTFDPATGDLELVLLHDATK